MCTSVKECVDVAQCANRIKHQLHTFACCGAGSAYLLLDIHNHGDMTRDAVLESGRSARFLSPGCLGPGCLGPGCHTCPSDWIVDRA